MVWFELAVVIQTNMLTFCFVLPQTLSIFIDSLSLTKQPFPLLPPPHFSSLLLQTFHNIFPKGFYHSKYEENKTFCHDGSIDIFIVLVV